MNLFLSWSGERSKAVAKVIIEYLEMINNPITIFFSDNIEKGARWEEEIFNNLEKCDYGIVCLTKDNLSAPWVNFEAGAAHKAIKGKPLTSLLIDLDPSDVTGPLTKFQNTRVNREELLNLVTSINECQSENTKSKDEVLNNTFNRMWVFFEHDLNMAISHKEEEGEEPLKDETAMVADLRPAIDEILMYIRRNDRSETCNSIDAIKFVTYLRTLGMDLSGHIDRSVEMTIRNITRHVNFSQDQQRKMRSDFGRMKSNEERYILDRISLILSKIEDASDII